jgi:predicted nucleic acid-binding protein
MGTLLLASLVLLDSGPLGLACSRPGTPLVQQCWDWLESLEVKGTEILIPSVCDFEVRRELLRLRATTKIENLNWLRTRFGYANATRVAWDRASEYWAFLRQRGLPTAGKAELDADTILAGIATTVGELEDSVVIATMNLTHFERFPGIDARSWLTVS